MDPHEPYWHTNTSFSPTPSRWDFRFQSEGLPFSLHDGVQLNGSSASSNGKGGRGWMRGNRLHDLHYSASDATEPFVSTTFDHSQLPRKKPPAVQEISLHDFETATRKDPSLGHIFSTPPEEKEGSSKNPDSGSELSAKSHSSETLACAHSDSHGDRCNLCERFISQRSPWSSRRIVISGDMPITGVLPCRHVFHVECLDQTTPTTHKNDPPCPLCILLEESFSSSSLFGD